MPASKPTKAKTPSRKTKAGSGRKVAEHRRKLFVESFLANGGNASKAALAAGFSAQTAGVTGHKMLKHPHVVLMLEQRQAALVEKFSLNTESVLRNLSQAIFFDPRKMFNPDGSVKRLIDLDDDTAMALSGFETIEMAGEVVATTKKVKWLDKNAARDQANKILGQYKEKLEITGDDQILKAIFSGRARAAQR